ncbi:MULTISPECIES: flagellar protein FlgN [Roseovarius]|uniref:flagellar protein FlgN n=1 Tax=Roseovarius TaxID=74030 RepID=UPI001C95ACB9|nr:flagellar protein FlgN [Roseovarius atlanticus]MBY5987069.1 flagellar protein FlgN [Roseovarius atlanticus]MBY6125709.1 flagellar protein FlgN [Roseovarius atlanticus]MBY6149830.1 flagellar protein FlgN [Roseovarius atlanticus]
MSETSAQTLIDELDRLLDFERQAVLDGNLQEMSDIIRKKECLIDALSDLDASHAAPMSEIQDKLTRNQTLLDGALQGIRRASARLAAVRKVRRTLETYGEDGQKKTIDARVARQLEKRA